MKKLIICGVLVLFSSSSYSDQYVDGYMKNNGTYVDGYYRSRPNNNVYDNYSTRGNTNPYTGQKGSKSYDSYNPSYTSPSQNNNYGWDNPPPRPSFGY